MELQSAVQLHNLIGVRGSVMTFRHGRAIEVDRAVRTSTGLFFSGINRDGQNVDFEVLGESIWEAQFVITSKARVNWPW